MRSLAEHYKHNHDEILQWIAEQFICQSIDLPLFSSIDVRNSGHKIAHVDFNLFPSGFNNIDQNARQLSAEACREYLQTYYPKVKKILLYPEQFSRNEFYFANLNILLEILKNAGFECDVILHDDIFEDVNLKRKIRPSDVMQSDSEIILLNNDLTTGVPDFLAKYHGTILPSPNLGWHSRRKSRHFLKFDELLVRVAKQFKFDPWLLSTYNAMCENIDFRERKNIECIARKVDKVIKQVTEKYREYGIKNDPYVFIKSDQGTFGLGIMTARSGDEVLQINKKTRHSMQKIKLGVENTRLMIQEGVPSIEKSEQGHTAEEMIYSVFARPSCIFNRIHKAVDEYSNLNASGMTFGNFRTLQPDDLRYMINRIANIATIYELL